MKDLVSALELELLVQSHWIVIEISLTLYEDPERWNWRQGWFGHLRIR
jgi:hypothetical protein